MSDQCHFNKDTDSSFKTTGHEQQTNTQTQEPSPVAKPPKPVHKGKILLVVLLGGIFSYFIFGNHPKSKTEISKPEPIPTEVLKAPILQTEIAKPITPTPSHDELDKDIENEKLQKIRLLAPGTMYAADQQRMGHTSGTQSNSALFGDNTDANAQFMSRLNNGQAPVTMATHIKHPGYTLAQGTLIWATLETQIASDLPGMVRAITSQDIYSEDGSQILLPRGSRLVGQYTSSIAQGQNRVFVVWQRAIRPDHIDIQLNSPGIDPLGAAGFAANGINRHFWQQFGNALLLSVIGAGTATIGVNGAQDEFNSATAYREALAGSFSQTAQDSLGSTGVIKPTIYINQGKRISVFVAQDLDFYNELRAR